MPCHRRLSNSEASTGVWAAKELSLLVRSKPRWVVTKPSRPNDPQKTHIRPGGQGDFSHLSYFLPGLSSRLPRLRLLPLAGLIPSRSFPKLQSFWHRSLTANCPFYGSTSHKPAVQTHTPLSHPPECRASRAVSLQSDPARPRVAP